MQEKLDQLITAAQARMRRVRDPIHGIDHVERVVSHAHRLCATAGITGAQRDALILAAWGHDVSRSMTKKPSLVLMPLFDDLLSALTLWKHTIAFGLFGSVAGMATRLIFCKGLGTGMVLTRVL